MNAIAKSHTKSLAKVTDPCDLFGIFIDHVVKLDRLAAQIKRQGSKAGMGRTLRAERSWARAIDARARELDAEDDMGIHGHRVTF